MEKNKVAIKREQSGACSDFAEREQARPKVKDRIYLCLAHMPEVGLEQKFNKNAFDTNWVVPLGPNVNGLEKGLEKICGLNKRVVAWSNM